MANEPVYITTPAGRFIMGDAFVGSDKDHQGRQRLDQKGQPKTQWFMAIAIPKGDPGWPDLWGQITGAAQRDFPNGEWQRPDFAWKTVDGDTKYPDRPECQGCYIIRCSSGFAPQVFNAQNQQLTDANQIKRGDYVRAYLSVRGNDDRQKPGVYLNHQLVQLVGYGEAILSGPSAEQAFGAPVALPPGASATPTAPTAPMPAPAGAYPAGAPMPAPAGAYPAGAPMPAPQQPNPMPAPVPATDPVAPAGYPPQTPAPVGAAVPGQQTAYPSNPAVQPHTAILTGPTQ